MTDEPQHPDTGTEPSDDAALEAALERALAPDPLHASTEPALALAPGWDAIAHRGRRRATRRRAGAGAVAASAALLIGALSVRAATAPGPDEGLSVVGSVPGSDGTTPSPSGSDPVVILPDGPVAPPTTVDPLPAPAELAGPPVITCADVEFMAGGFTVNGVDPTGGLESGRGASLRTAPEPSAGSPSSNQPHRQIVVGDGGSLRVVYEVDATDPGIEVSMPTQVANWVYFIEIDGGLPGATLRRVPFDGGPPEDVVADLGTLIFAVSPDLSRVALLGRAEGEVDVSLVIVDSGDGTRRVLGTTTSDGSELMTFPLLWSSDSRHLFVTAKQPERLIDCATGELLADPDDQLRRANPTRPLLPSSDALRVLRVDADRPDLDTGVTIARAGTTGVVTILEGREVVAVLPDQYTRTRPGVVVEGASGALLPFEVVRTDAATATFFENRQGYLIRPL